MPTNAGRYLPVMLGLMFLARAGSAQEPRLAWRPSGGLELALAGQNLLHDRHAEFGAVLILRTLVLAGALLVPAVPGPTQQYGQPSAEQVKAVFLFHFAQFVEWPVAAFAAPEAPLVIGVLGDDPFGAYLDETVRGEVVRGHPLEVRRYGSMAAIDACHILYVSRSEAEQLPEILRHLRGRPILTVGEGTVFVRSGGVIAFSSERNRIRMRINNDAALAAKLSISSKLLRVAEAAGEGNR